MIYQVAVLVVAAATMTTTTAGATTTTTTTLAPAVAMAAKMNNMHVVAHSCIGAEKKWKTLLSQ